MSGEFWSTSTTAEAPQVTMESMRTLLAELKPYSGPGEVVVWPATYHTLLEDATTQAHFGAICGLPVYVCYTVREWWYALSRAVRRHRKNKAVRVAVIPNGNADVERMIRHLNVQTMLRKSFSE